MLTKVNGSIWKLVLKYNNFTSFRFLSSTGKIMEVSNKVKLSERLSRLVVPTNYTLKLCPDLEAKTFSGNVEIKVNVKEERSHISFHSKFLDINDVRVTKGSENINVSKYLEVKQTEQILVQFDEKLAAGDYCLSVDFSGDLANKFVGFYSSDFGDSTMVASKFQPTYARQAFPCFDEPDFKATYDISLVKPAGYTALSNMNQISSIADTKSKSEIVTFATSVPMSTYLACFVICDFDFKETIINSNGIGKDFTLRSFAQKGETHKIDFAQDIGKRATEFYINYYQVPFPLPKLDMIAIPDYVSGATEHWGLITYRETAFLIDEATASSSTKIAVANTIAHELAHMWFGNLVTMKWWDEIWLNEGFATYMQVKALNAIEPSWTMLDQFLTRTLHSVLDTDARLASHPVVQTVDTPDQITAIFDAISYNKGSSILRMLEGFVGEEGFRRGVTDYLKRHMYGNTVQSDLLRALEPYFDEKHPGHNLASILATWTRQQGYPALGLRRAGPRRFTVTQTRFLLDPDAESPNDSPYGYRWYIPITYKTDKGQSDEIIWFSDKEDSVTITLKEDVKWLKINNNQVGYYRVNYEEDAWQKLADELNSKSQVLSISDRAQLLNDVFALGDSRRLPLARALALTSFLRQEVDYVPWVTAGRIFEDLNEKLMNTAAHGDLKKYVRSLVKPLYEKQSWEKTNNTVIEGLLRSTILSLATHFGEPAAEKKTREMFLQYLNSHGTDSAVSIEPSLRNLVYQNGMKQASPEEWEKLWNIYLKERDVQESSRLRAALAAAGQPALLRRYLDLAWDESHVRSQDYLSLLTIVADTPAGAALAWAEVRQHWPRLVDRFSLNSRYLGNVIPGVTAGFNTEDRLEEMESFFVQYPEAGAGAAARRRALENVKNNIKWTKHNYPVVADWLAKNA